MTIAPSEFRISGTVNRRGMLHVLLASVLVSCADSKPSVSNGEEAFRANVAGEAKGLLKVSDFRKTDGQAGELGGVKVYQMMFTANVVFIKDASFNLSRAGFPAMFGLEADKINANELKEVRNDGLVGFFNASQGISAGRVGDVLRVTGTEQFEKRESGWVPSGMAFRAVLDSSSRRRVAQTEPSSGKPSDNSNAMSSVCQGAAGVNNSVTAFLGTTYHKKAVSNEPEMSFGGWGDRYFDYIRFELPSAPVSKAVLCVFATTIAPNDPRLSVAVAVEAWQADSLSVENAPTLKEVTKFGPVSAGWNGADVSEIVHGWSTGTAKNYGFILVPNANDHTNGTFASGFATDPTHRPKLILK